MKRSKSINSLIIFLALFMYSWNTYAQVYSFTKGWSVGLAAGATKFHGDLTDRSSFLDETPFSAYFYKERKFAGTFVLEKAISPYFGIRGMILYGSIESSQKASDEYFEADYFDYTLNLTLDFTNIILGPDGLRDYRVFGFVGMGLSHSSTIKYNSTTGKIVSGRIGQKSMIETIGPIGIGFSLFPNRVVSYNFESSLHIVHTNKLDRTPVVGTIFESVGFISLGVVFNLYPSDAHVRNRNSFEGRSNDPSIRAFNKRRRVVMRTRRNRKAFKKQRRRSR
jgi:hypothetical protein